MNDWHISGRVLAVESRKTRAGTPFHTIEIAEDREPPDRPGYCKCVWWHVDAPTEGTLVEASGRMNLGEYQGRRYQRNECLELRPVETVPPLDATAPTAPAADEPDNANEDIPF